MRNLREVLGALEPGQLMENEPMSRHTTFRVGGPAQWLFFPASADQIERALDFARAEGLPSRIIGNGSNLIVRDGGLPGLTIALGEKMSEIRIEGARLCAQAGAMLSRVAAAAQEAGLSGLEFASGIPGTLGGGCAMNAGAYGGQIADVLVSAEVLLDGARHTLNRAELELGYRTSLPLRRGGVVLSAAFELTKDDPEEILARMRELNARRREKQPLNLPSAGSVFKRPEGHFAGALIEGCGLKGRSVGGAQVSPKHAGFIVNTGNATAADVIALIREVQEAVFRETGVSLETEVRILGED